MSVAFGGTVWLILQGLQCRGIVVLHFLPLPTWLPAAAAFALATKRTSVLLCKC
ncbi:MAG TPA: hypothetical protein VGH81_09430 [Rudaea sp.]|jgi:hypothetical protein